jgi:hypothetical protein
MAGQGKKTFVAGEVLLAQDVNDYLMDQSVMNFATVAARSSAIPTPTTGMVSYVGTTGTATIPQIETYTGAGWQTPYGLTLIATQTFSNAAAINMNNVFTSSFINYRVMIQSYASDNVGMNLQFRNAGANRITSSYINQSTGSYGGGTAFNSGTTATSFDMGAITAEGFYVFDVFAPQVATSESWLLGQGFGYQNNVSAWVQRNFGMNYNEVNSNDGFAITSSGTASCTISVYGYRTS